MKIFWLASYPISDLVPELKIKNGFYGHPCSWVSNLAKKIAEDSEIELHIIISSAHIPYSQSLRKFNINFHVVKYSMPFTNKGFPNYFPFDSLTWYFGFIRKALKILKRHHIDLIHAHGVEKGYSLLAYFSKTKSVTSIQGSLKSIFPIEPSLKALSQIPIEKFCLRKNSIFGCRTQWDKQLVLSSNPRASVYYMPEMINPVFFEKSWKGTESNDIVYVGSIIRRKGVETLILALSILSKEFPNLKVTLIGSYNGKYKNTLCEKARNLGVEDKVIFLGPKSSEEISSKLADSLLFVLPSMIENSPNSLAEAMAMGVPCIASNVGGIPTIIEDSKNGLLFEVNNHNDLAEKILRIVKNKPFGSRIGGNAKITSLRRNYPDFVLKETIKVYHNIVNASND